MNNAAEILKSVQIGLDVATFLLKTDRGLRATELCNECAILLQNLNSHFHLDISDVLFNAYYAICGNRNAERHANKLLETLHNAGIQAIQLGDKYTAKSRFVEAKQLFKSARTITKTIGHKKEEAVAHGRLGNVCSCLGALQMSKKHYQKALA